MKYTNKITFLLAVIFINTALFSGAFAQRNNDNRERHSEKRDNVRSDRNTAVNNDRNFNRNNDRPAQSTNSGYQRNQVTTRPDNSYRNNTDYRNNTAYNRDNQGYNRNRNNNVIFQNQRNTSSLIRYSGRNYPSYYNYRNYNYGSRYISWRPYYRTLPRTYISINFGGHPYYYGDGYFYDYYDGYYRPFFPPRGIHISFLPFGYYPIYIGADIFYYANGTYYRKYDDTNYEVIDAPVGATISTLPAKTKAVLINGEKFYELNGTYYKEGTDAKGKVMYTVVGKNGEITNTDETTGSTAPLRVGDVIAQLPADCKRVDINGESLLVTPNEVYLKEETSNNGVSYKVVGVPQ